MAIKINSFSSFCGPYGVKTGQDDPANAPLARRENRGAYVLAVVEKGETR